LVVYPKQDYIAHPKPLIHTTTNESVKEQEFTLVETRRNLGESERRNLKRLLPVLSSGFFRAPASPLGQNTWRASDSIRRNPGWRRSLKWT
jgi:hypothetical protein